MNAKHLLIEQERMIKEKETMDFGDLHLGHV